MVWPCFESKKLGSAWLGIAFSEKSLALLGSILLALSKSLAWLGPLKSRLGPKTSKYYLASNPSDCLADLMLKDFSFKKSLRSANVNICWHRCVLSSILLMYLLVLFFQEVFSKFSSFSICSNLKDDTLIFV